MAKKILTFDNYAKAFEAVPKYLGEGLDKKYYVVTPNKYTLFAEKLLFGKKGSFCAQVTTFSRLYYRVCETLSAISKEGGIMILKSVLSSLKLNYYNRSKTYSGFATKVYDAIKTLMDAGIKPCDLKGEKFADLAIIYEAYLSQIEGKYVDSAGQLKALQANAKFFVGSRVIIVGFNGYTAAEKQLIDEIANHTEVIVLDRAEGKVLPVNPVRIISAGGKADLLKQGAKILRNSFIAGVKPEEVAVISPPTAFERIKRIFAEYEIPFYIDAKKQLSEYPSGGILCALAEAERSNYSATSLIALAKNPYSTLTKEEADGLEIYLGYIGADRKAFFDKFTVEAAFYAQAESARAKLSALILESKALLASEIFADGVKKLLDMLKIPQTVAERSKKGGEIGEDGFAEKESNLNKILALAEVIDKVGIADNRLSLLAEGIRSTAISRLPSVTGQVTVGEASTFRGMRPKVTVLLGCNEGQIPSFAQEDGILRDRDIKALNEGEKLITDRRERNEKQENEILEIISLSKNIYALVDCAGESKRSDFLYLLTQKKPIKKSVENELLYDCCSGSAALEKLIISIAEYNAGGEFKKEMGAIYDAVKDKAEAFIQPPPPFRCEQEGKSTVADGTYISQLQTFFECPAKHFFRYGLRLKKREKAELTPLDIGNLMHRIVEIVVGRGNFDDVKGEVMLATDIAVSEGVKYELETNADLIQRIEQESEKVIEILIDHLQQGKFTNPLTETEFGGDKWKGVLLPCDPPLTLRGKIDMMDFYGDGVRIIDYKTGQAKFSFSDVYYGKKIQLPLYMAAAMQNGYKPLGMFLFPLKSSWKDDDFSHRFSGAYRGEWDTALLMDGNLAGEYESQVISAKTKYDKKEQLKFYGTSQAMDCVEFDAVIAYALRIAAYGVDKIREGYCEPSPLKAIGDPCLSCDYYYACKGGSARATGSVKPDTMLRAVVNPSGRDEKREKEHKERIEYLINYEKERIQEQDERTEKNMKLSQPQNEIMDKRDKEDGNV